MGSPTSALPKRSSAAPLRNQTRLSSVMLKTASLLDSRIVAARVAVSSDWVTAATSSREPIEADRAARRRRGRWSPGAGPGAGRRRCAGPGTRSGRAPGAPRPRGGPRSTRSASGPASSWRARPRRRRPGRRCSSPTRRLAQMRRSSSSVLKTPTGTRRRGASRPEARAVTRHVRLRGAGQPSSLGSRPRLHRQEARQVKVWRGRRGGCYYPRRRNCPGIPWARRQR